MAHELSKVSHALFQSFTSLPGTDHLKPGFSRNVYLFLQPFLLVREWDGECGCTMEPVMLLLASPTGLVQAQTAVIWAPLLINSFTPKLEEVLWRTGKPHSLAR